MAKLYFRYGVVGSAKTLNLLAVAHNYEKQGKRVVTVKPAIDTRYGVETIGSRAGLSRKADIIIGEGYESAIARNLLTDCSCILVEEAQFFAADFIDSLRDIADSLDIPVICYGLRASFKNRLFEGSLRLMELSDSIEEVKTTCYFCNKKAIFNGKMVDGRFVSDGNSIEIGGDEKYFPLCAGCYNSKVNQ
jgi:thymidine kinase